MAYTYAQQVPSPSGYGYPHGGINSYPVYNPLTGTTAGSTTLSELPSDLLVRQAMAGQLPWVSTDPNVAQAGIMGSVAPPLARTLPSFNSLVNAAISPDMPTAPSAINIGSITPSGSSSNIYNTSGTTNPLPPTPNINNISSYITPYGYTGYEPGVAAAHPKPVGTGGNKNMITSAKDNLIAKPPIGGIGSNIMDLMNANAGAFIPSQIGGQSIIPGGMTPQQFAGTQGGLAGTLANQTQVSQGAGMPFPYLQGMGGITGMQGSAAAGVIAGAGSNTNVPQGANIPGIFQPPGQFPGTSTGQQPQPQAQPQGQAPNQGSPGQYPGSFDVNFSMPTPYSITQPLGNLSAATENYVNQVPQQFQQLLGQMSQQQGVLSNPDLYNAIIQRSLGGAANVSGNIMNQFLPQQQAISGQALNQAQETMQNVYNTAINASQAPGIYNPINQAAERGGQQVSQAFNPALQLATSGLLTNPYEQAATQANQQTSGIYGDIYQGLQGKLTQDVNAYMASLGGATQPEAAARIVSQQMASQMAPYLAEQAKSQSGIYQQSALGQAGTLTDLLKNQAMQEAQAKAGIYGTSAEQIGGLGGNIIGSAVQGNTELQRKMAEQYTQNLSNLQNTAMQQAIQTAGGGIPGMLQQAQAATGKSGEAIQTNLLDTQRRTQDLQKQMELMQQGYASGLNQLGYEARTGIQDVGQGLQLAMAQNQADYTNQLMQSELARQQSALQEQTNRQVRGAYEFYNDMMKQQAEANQNVLQGVYNQMAQSGGGPTIYGTYQPNVSYNTPSSSAPAPSSTTSNTSSNYAQNTGGGTTYTSPGAAIAGAAALGGSAISGVNPKKQGR